MNIQVASDLHLEFYSEEQSYSPSFFETLIKPIEGVNVLLLAGDIGYPEDTITKLFFAWCCEMWLHVIWVLGNHEYYTRKKPQIYTMAEKEQFAEDYMAVHPNLAVLINSIDDTFDHVGFRILGTTMWTDVGIYDQQHLRRLNDFQMIRTEPSRSFQITDWQLLHQLSIDFLEEQLNECEILGLQAIIVTHHLPTYKMIPEQYQGSDLNCGFAAHAEDVMNHPAIRLWVCGHSHGQQTLLYTKPNGASYQCVLNARGYPKEDSLVTYSPQKVIRLSIKDT